MNLTEAKEEVKRLIAEDFEIHGSLVREMVHEIAGDLIGDLGNAIEMAQECEGLNDVSGLGFMPSLQRVAEVMVLEELVEAANFHIDELEEDSDLIDK
jgi:hypothetical protein